MRFLAIFLPALLGLSFSAAADITLSPGASAQVGGQTIHCSGQSNLVVISCDCEAVPREYREDSPHYAIYRSKTSISGQHLARMRLNQDEYVSVASCERAMIEAAACRF